MKNDLDDLAYSKRQRWEGFQEIFFAILSVGLVVFIITMDIAVDLPLPLTVGGLGMSVVVGEISLIYGLSRRHRRDHKQLYDILNAFLKPTQTDVEPDASGNRRPAPRH